MARKGNPISIGLVSIVVFLVLSLLILFGYLVCILLGWDWNFLCQKIQFMLLGKGIHFLFNRLGWCVGGLIFAIFCSLFDPESMSSMMGPSAPSGGSGSSNSTSWEGKTAFEEQVLMEPFPETETEGSSSSVGASSGASSGVDQASGSRDKSALDQRKDELIIENLKERKGDLGDGQQVSDIRKTVETHLNVENIGEQFEFIKQMEKETGAKKEDCPVTNSTFNEIREYESQIQDGKGVGRQNSWSNQDKADDQKEEH